MYEIRWKPNIREDGWVWEYCGETKQEVIDKIKEVRAEQYNENSWDLDIEVIMHERSTVDITDHFNGI